MQVFKVFWSEPAGEASDFGTDITRDARFGQSIYSKVRRFVVIREEDYYCSAMYVHVKYPQRSDTELRADLS